MATIGLGRLLCLGDVSFGQKAIKTCTVIGTPKGNETHGIQLIATDHLDPSCLGYWDCLLVTIRAPDRQCLTLQAQRGNNWAIKSNKDLLVSSLQEMWSGNMKVK